MLSMHLHLPSFLSRQFPYFVLFNPLVAWCCLLPWLFINANTKNRNVEQRIGTWNMSETTPKNNRTTTHQNDKLRNKQISKQHQKQTMFPHQIYSMPVTSNQDAYQTNKQFLQCAVGVFQTHEGHMWTLNSQIFCPGQQDVCQRRGNPPCFPKKHNHRIAASVTLTSERHLCDGPSGPRLWPHADLYSFGHSQMSNPPNWTRLSIISKSGSNCMLHKGFLNSWVLVQKTSVKKLACRLGWPHAC